MTAAGRSTGTKSSAFINAIQTNTVSASGAIKRRSPGMIALDCPSTISTAFQLRPENGTGRRWMRGAQRNKTVKAQLRPSEPTRTGYPDSILKNQPLRSGIGWRNSADDARYTLKGSAFQCQQS